MDEQLRNALFLHEVKFVKELFNSSDKRLQPPVIGYKVLSDRLHEFKWTLQKVVMLGVADLTRLFLRAGNGLMNLDEGLHGAVSNLDVDHVKLFLQEFNADPNSFDEDSHTPIYHLYFKFPIADDYRNIYTCNELEIMKMLIARGAKMVTPRDGYNDLQVKKILAKGTTEAVSIILDMDVIDLKEQFDGGYTVAHFLAQNQNPNTLTLLQNRDFPVNMRNESGYSPLAIAAEFGVAEAVEFLLKKGAAVNLGNATNDTPVNFATLEFTQKVGNYMECINLLLEHGADVQARSVPHDNLRSYTVFDVLRVQNDDQRPAGEVIMQHLALQTAIGTTITEYVQNTIDSYAMLKEQLDTGRKLLQSQIFRSHTLFSVLTCGEEKLVSFMRNKQLAEKLQSHSDHLMSINSIYYNRMLQKRLTKSSKIIELRGKAAFVVGKLMKFNYNCQTVVVDIVLQYLDLADLDTLLSSSFSNSFLL